ncbi:MAG: response regulator transcription factor [Chloroflexi bacterium]|nr:response regulator transcription factor [Chloroflexota bacterium]
MAKRNTIPKELNILIVTPRGLAREGLRLVVEQDEDLRVVGFAANADAALESLRQTRAQVVIVAHYSDNQECVACVQRLKATEPVLPVLIISSDIRPDHVQAALAAGATGYLPQDAEPDELLRAIYTVYRGELMLRATIVPRLLSHLGIRHSGDSTPALDDLTHRERDILVHLARGLSDQDIAQTLFISVRTVQSHLAHIYAKLNVHSRTEAALIAVREGWASPMEHP